MIKNRKTYIKPESYAIEMGDMVLASTSSIGIGISGEVEDKPGRMAPKYYGIEDDMDDMDDVGDAGFGY